MSEKSGKAFASKHGRKTREQIDPAVRESLERHAPQGELACAVAFRACIVRFPFLASVARSVPVPRLTHWRRCGAAARPS